MGRANGITEEQLLDLGSFETSAAFTDLEKAVLEYATALSNTPVTVAEELTERLREHFDEAQMVELTATIAWENHRARFNRAFDIASQGYSEGAVCALPARKVLPPHRG